MQKLVSSAKGSQSNSYEMVRIILLKHYPAYRDYARDASWVQWKSEDIIYNVMVLCVCIICCIKVNGQQVPHTRSLALSLLVTTFANHLIRDCFFWQQMGQVVNCDT